MALNNQERTWNLFLSKNRILTELLADYFREEYITKKWNTGELDDWIYDDGRIYRDFELAYQTKFNEQFGNYITPEIKRAILLSSRNAAYALRAFYSAVDDENRKLNDIRMFIRLVIEDQFENICEWCNIYQVMSNTTLSQTDDPS